VYFISASPPQIGRAVRRKLEIDGIVHDGIIFKDQLQRLMRGKFRHLREHVGYKLTELLKARRSEPPGAREYLFGDDWESDPLIYSLYADVVAAGSTPSSSAICCAPCASIRR
jgi:phosphatidate phosphatase APP1